MRKVLVVKPVMYMGERVSFYPQKIYKLFKGRDGTEYKFAPSVSGVYFGDKYQLLPKDRMEHRPKELSVDDWQPTESERLEYEAQKIVCREFRATKRKDLELKKPHPNILKALELLRPFAMHLDETERGRLFSWLRIQCSKRKARK